MEVILVFVFMVSLFLGSFYNVVGLRALSKEDIVAGRSHCVNCKHELSYLDMIPVFSYLFLGGKCRYCDEKISYIYPFGEVLTAVAYTSIIYRFGLNPKALIHIAFATTMVIASVTDLKEKIVPDIITGIGILIVFLLRVLLKESPLSYLLAGLGAFGVLYLIFMLSGGKMGGADVKIYALVGLSIGFVNSMLSLFYASCIALLVYVLRLILGYKKQEIEIPFIPYITMGALLTYYIDIWKVLNFLS